MLGNGPKVECMHWHKIVDVLQAAKEDLETVQKLAPSQPGLQQQEQHLQQLMACSKASDATLLQQMVSGQGLSQESAS